VLEINSVTVLVAGVITAMMTGLGALPFLFVRKITGRLLGYSYAAAAGLMLAASHSLIAEGAALNAQGALLGVFIGLGAIIASNRLIPSGDGLALANLSSVDTRKVLLILGIMTAHSFAEGVGVGVSFGGTEALGIFITTAIALHNVPEGLAIALVLVPRGTPVWQAAGWSIFTSLPQPLMAVPAFVFVQEFAPFLPIGLGIAAGAMIWMVFAELIPDAMEEVSAHAVATAVTLAFTLMLAFQLLVMTAGH
jgi:ZIP family zinc transporter